MTKYTFIAEHDDLYGNPSGHKVSTEFTADHISTVLENFDLFLRGVGFYPQGTLDYIPEEEYNGYDQEQEWQNEEFETPQDDLQGYAHIKDDDIVHSKFYFDIERNK
jgi:hypothetical protein